jgi:hypothetical protein
MAPYASSQGRPTLSMRLLFSALFILLSAVDAPATSTYCAAVLRTPDGFLALRSGPGTGFPIRTQLRSFDVLLVDTGTCRESVCDRSGQWVFVEGVPRIDGPEGSGLGRTQGWVYAPFTRQIACPNNPGIAPSGEIQGCFVRTYGGSHLASHPHQLVTHVRLQLRSAQNRAHHVHDFSLEIRTRGSVETLNTVGSCTSEHDRLECRVECDGGGIAVAPRAGYAMMYLDRIRMSKCDAKIDDVNSGVEVFGGIDDRVFRLDSVGAAQCQHMQ